MALIGLLALILSPMSAMRKQAAGLAPGATPPEDYADATYRWHRAYANLTEATGSFALVTLAAILAGAAPFWVNLFATVFLVARLVMLVIHLRGGKPHMGARSIVYVLGWVMCILLAIFAIVAAFGGAV